MQELVELRSQIEIDVIGKPTKSISKEGSTSSEAIERHGLNLNV